MTSGGQGMVNRSRDVLFVLPPDVSAPSSHLVFRFPPLGPAVVAACVPNLHFRALDLARQLPQSLIVDDQFVLVDQIAVERYLRGQTDERIERAIEPIMEALAALVPDFDFIAISVDRGSQVLLTAILSVHIKRRWDKRIVVGGVAMENLRNLFLRTGAIGADIVTTASTPAQIRGAFVTLLELPEHRHGPPIESNTDLVELVRGGMRKAPAPIDWPMPDFSIYDLALYRRDAFQAQFPNASSYAGEIGASLVLPYFFTFECQFSCAFCQTGGTQENKNLDTVVRELASLSEKWETREFLFFDTQINLHARAFAQALLDARLDLRWSDSYRVRPSEPGDLELMARAGCASLTVGVESASERVLKSMVKGHKPEHATEMIRRAHENEILVRVNLLACYPGETREEFLHTCNWLRENAALIDDIAPSSFYLTADSPLGRKPERYGIRIRGSRVLQGEGKFRKSPDSLEYDEIDGLTWEEREPLLETAEKELANAWMEGRGDLGPLAGLAPSTMLALRRYFPNKSVIHEFIRKSHGIGTAVETRTESIVETSQSQIPLQPVLLAPRVVRPAIARAFFVCLRLAEQTPTFRAREGDTLHAILFSDGAFIVFRGSVTRTNGGLAQAIDVDEIVGDFIRISPTDPRAEALMQRGMIKLTDGTVFSRFEVFSFRMAPIPMKHDTPERAS